jgi:hypothetical protein
MQTPPQIILALPCWIIKEQSGRRYVEIIFRYRVPMLDIAAPLMNALATARRRLGDAADATARSQTTVGGTQSDGGMAQVAERAIFSETLLAATHARLEEVKSVTRQ